MEKAIELFFGGGGCYGPAVLENALVAGSEVQYTELYFDKSG